MGIKGLFKVISDNAPHAVRTVDWPLISGRKVAIDASMSLYQFLVAVRQQDGAQLSGIDGQETSHLIGMFYRTIKLIEHGVLPVYVFDGKPPDLKRDELDKRLKLREEATEKSEAADTLADANKFSRRTVHATKEHNEEAQKLLRLMGVPVVLAPSEAESSCAALVKGGKVHAAGSEDMDTLTFGAKVLLRKLTAGDQKKNPITEINLEKALEGLELNYEQFVDLCILLGCDYCEPIRGMGPQTALKLIKEHKSIEKIKEHLETQTGKLKIPDTYPYVEVRKLFVTPDVVACDNVDLKFEEPDLDGLIQFLVTEKGFSEDRVRQNHAKLKKSLNQKPQQRLTDFFQPIKRAKPNTKPAKRGKKK
ncbi:multifunctional nuclease [Starmerella bacillaris]|uniref:Flap endonuclease 1 n=1 Tax=Starmerella bacillaris TaxID=1247836 RepID=A0AAV5RHH4_STABA|nr:multifunctional nuclease [Starmerella bacillaris]